MDPFATLGLPRRFDVDLAAAEKTHRELSRALHPDKFAQAGASEKRDALSRAVEVNEAWRVVRDPIRRAEALFALAGVAVGEGKEPKADPEFLMDMMELREALSDARAEKDLDAIRLVSRGVSDREAKAFERLTLGFASGDAAALTAVLGELRFYRRFLDEASAIEEAITEAAHAAH